MKRCYPPELLEDCYQAVLRISPPWYATAWQIAHSVAVANPVLYRTMFEKRRPQFVAAVRARLHVLAGRGSIRRSSAIFGPLPQP